VDLKLLSLLLGAVKGVVIPKGAANDYEDLDRVD
jgi:hypothetical protein